ncbi:MAG: sodium:calcium antiporter [Candidatus Cyclobacteriaceae bacterium M3_2C_046]
MGIVIPIIIVLICCIIIWRTGDSFETASQFLGRKLSDGVRGATINAIASSMPELLTTLIFLINIQGANGFSGGIGTTAGSAIYNSMVIPAFVGIIVFFKLSVKKFRFTRKVIIRDGLFLLLIESIFIFILSSTYITWKDGLVLILVYFGYLFFMFFTMKGKLIEPDGQDDPPSPNQLTPKPVLASIFPIPNQRQMVAFLKLDLNEAILGDQKINKRKAWTLLAVSTAVMAASCMLLVQATEFLGSDTYHLPFLGELHGLGIPIMFVALILVSAASSVPDTIISMKDAQKGNYDDAFSNVLGSNIFDICFALGLPLFIYTLLYGPFTIPPAIMEITLELRIILIVLTFLALLIFIVGKNFTRAKAYLLLTIYGFFILYVIVKSLDKTSFFENLLM